MLSSRAHHPFRCLLACLLILTWVHLTMGNLINNYANTNDCYDLLKALDTQLLRVHGLIGNAVASLDDHTKNKEAKKIHDNPYGFDEKPIYSKTYRI